MHKYGDIVLPVLIPIYVESLHGEEVVRKGICFGLAQVIPSCGRNTFSAYIGKLIPVLLEAISDESVVCFYFIYSVCSFFLGCPPSCLKSIQCVLQSQWKLCH